MNLFKGIKNSAKHLSSRHGWCHVAKKQTGEMLKMGTGELIFMGMGAGISKALEGPRSLDMSGDFDWSYIDQSPSVLKVNEVGPQGSGPSTLSVVVGLVVSCLVLMALAPIIKLFISFNRMFGCCCKSSEREEPASSTAN